MALALATAAAMCCAVDGFVRLTPMGIGRYGNSPALFLGAERGANVLPVPVPKQCELAFEQALSPSVPSQFEVLQGSRGPLSVPTA